MEQKIVKALQTFFGCKVVLRKDGTLTTSGRDALRRLARLLESLGIKDDELDGTIIDMFYRV
jgi:hypothetical protein